MEGGRRPGGRWSAWLVPWMVGACVGGGAGYPEVEGRYEGTVVVEGQSIPGTLQLDQDGPSLTVVLQAPSLGLEARGTGRVSPDGEARVRVEYDLQCPGVADLVGDFGGGAVTFRGNVTASDCTGELAGIFDFARAG